MKRINHEIRFVVSDKLNDEIMYWIIRKGWDERKVILTKYEWTEEDVHDCVSHGYCERCANNGTMHFRSVVFGPYDSKESIELISRRGDQLGDAWSDYQ